MSQETSTIQAVAEPIGPIFLSLTDEEAWIGTMIGFTVYGLVMQDAVRVDHKRWEPAFDQGRFFFPHRRIESIQHLSEKGAATLAGQCAMEAKNRNTR